MARLSEISREAAPERTKVLLDKLAGSLYLTWAMTHTMAHSPAVLQGYLSLRDALQSGTLDPLLSVRIGLVIAEVNRIPYCLAAQATLGWLLGLEEAELEAARWARSSDPKIEVALRFACDIVLHQGVLTDEEFDRVRQAGYTDEEIAEIVGNVALHIATNYFNLVAQIEADSPAQTAGGPNVA